MPSSHSLLGHEIALARSKVLSGVFWGLSMELTWDSRFANDSMKMILAKTIWRFKMKLEINSQEWLKDMPSFVSLHQPPLLVSLEPRKRPSSD